MSVPTPLDAVNTNITPHPEGVGMTVVDDNTKFLNGDEITHKFHIPTVKYTMIQECAKSAADTIVAQGSIGADNPNKDGSNIRTGTILALLLLNQQGIDILPYTAANTPQHERLIRLATQNQMLTHYPLAQKLVAELPWAHVAQGHAASGAAAAR